MGKLLTQGDHIALEQMDSVWREKRKVISHNFSPKHLDEKHFLVQEAEYDMPDMLPEGYAVTNYLIEQLYCLTIS